ncbi:MAG: hypothetical protein HYW24_04460 [Candidatus Aenigmarchaeota archaeon]|nr:hypothetical protein [Candidatus Aenigmarchaeota archaeon]
MSHSRKGQFFILSAVAIITILYFVSRWLEPSTVIDTSYIVLLEEPFTLDNIFEKTVNVVTAADDCTNLDYNLLEYKDFIEDFALDKNYRIYFDYAISECSTSATVNVNISVLSDKVKAQKSFVISWPNGEII